MCGRFALKNPSKELKQYYNTANEVEYPARYNIAPSAPVIAIHTIRNSKDRHLIENFFARLKQYRAIATRYEKIDENFLAAIYAAATIDLLN